MSDCVNEMIGRKLHAFELGTLSDAEREEFELHLYECDHCFALVQQFQSPARLLRQDPGVRELVAETAKAATPMRSFSRTIRFAVAVAAVAMIIIVVTQRGGQPPEPQVVRLLPLRGMPNDVLRVDQGGDVEFRFVLDGADENTLCRLAIETAEGRAVYTQQRFDDFNDKGLGTISLPVESFSPGVYTLFITDLADTDPLPTAEYKFLVQ